LIRYFLKKLSRRRFAAIAAATSMLVIAIVLGARLLGDNNKKIAQVAPSSNSETAVDYSLAGDFALRIPKLDLLVPVVPDVDGFNKEKYSEALTSGLAHFSGTHKPGEGNNIFIFGHSSGKKTDTNKYKEIFAALPQLEIGDPIYLWYQNIELRYLVIEKKEVDKEDLSWLDDTPKEVLTLMTCYPIGTKDRRLIIRAEQL